MGYGDKSILIIADKQRGHQQMAVAIAESLNARYELLVVNPNLWQRLSGQYNIKSYIPGEFSLIISVGSKTGGYARAVNAVVRAKSVHLLSTGMLGGAKYFDMNIRPYHDGVAGPNILHINGALSPWNERRLQTARERFSEIFSIAPAPRVGILIGGHSRHGQYTQETAEHLRSAVNILSGMGYSILLTTSPRTPKFVKDYLGQHISTLPRAYGYFGVGENPYGGILAYCDVFVATGDSVSMVSEAIATQKPTYIFNIGNLPKKIQKFHQDSFNLGLARPFSPQQMAESFTPKPYHQQAFVIQEIQKLIG